MKITTDRALSAHSPPQPTTSATDLDAEALLHASRRLDWRFLLPDPNLGRVACVSPVEESLRESLRLFSASLTMVAVDAPGMKEAYDVVVSQPSPAALRHAAGLLKPGGFLYLEAQTKSMLSAKSILLAKSILFAVAGPGRGRRRPGWSGLAADLKQLGFVEVQAHWHWPNFQAATKIIPLDDRAALLFALAPARRGAAGRLKGALGRLLVWSGLLIWLAPCVSIVARKAWLSH